VFMKMRRVAVPLLFLALGACEPSEPPVSPNTVARAAGIDFTVDDAAAILAPQTQLPNQPMVVDALATLWVDYFLLARTTAEDSTLSNLDVSPLVQMRVDQELVLLLRDAVVQVDTAFSDEEVRSLYEAELPGSRVRARHILLRIPVGATQTQEDSVRALAENLRTRVQNGENFALLAGEFSQDPGSAPNGGDLGSFAKGEMVPAFEEVAFALEVGEVSSAVETSFGIHLIQVDERIIPPMEDNLEEFKAQLQNRRVMEAESTFVAGIVDSANIEVQSDGFETARQLTTDPKMTLTDRALDRTLVGFKGGSVSLRSFRDWIELRATGLRDEIRNSTDEQMEGLMQNLARERLLVIAASDQGLEVSQARQDSMALGIREGVKTVVQQMGFGDLHAPDAASADSIALEAVGEFLLAAVVEGREVIPLGGVAVALQRQYNARVFEPALERTVARITELRTQLPMNPLPTPEEAVSPDSGGAPAGDRNP
jgi:peptidyl-prolyl cis-trans isomerase C